MATADGAGGTPQAQSQRDALRSVRNAAKLGGSMVLTWGIALAVRLLMPRFMGPDAWGPINYADAFTTTFFVAISLGIDTYVRKEVSVRPEHASDFLGGLTSLRVVLSLLLFVAMELVMAATDRPPETRVLVRVYGLGNVFQTTNLTFAALLHAKGTVDELSLLNIASKIVWGLGTLLTLALGWPLAGIPGAYLASEMLKTAVGVWLLHRHLQVRWHFDGLAVKAAIIASLPMFLNGAAHSIYNKLDVSILAVVAGDKEVAWYGASSLLAGLTLMVAPMIGWVMLPLFARARARSEAEYTQVMRRSLELVLAVAFPTSLLVALGADLWVRLMYGPAYAPAAASLRVLSPLFVLTYVAMISANSLILTGRAWAQALISVAGLVVNPLLDWAFIPRGVAWFGLGGAGIGAGLAQLGTEIVVTTVMMAYVGTRAFDRRTVVMIAKTVAVCGVVAGLDRLMIDTLPPLARVTLDGVAYVALIVVTRALDLPQTVAFARNAFSRRHDPSAEPDSAPASERTAP